MTEPGTAVQQAASASTDKKSRFVSDILKLVSGTIFAQGLSVLIAPILSRLYTPDAFGTATIFISITGVIGVVSCLRYELAIMLPEHNEDAANVLAISLFFVLIITGLSTIAVLFGHRPTVELLNAPDLELYIWLIPLAVLANGGFLALNSWNSRTKHFGRLSIAQVSQSVMKTGTQLGMGLVRPSNAGGLIGGIVLGSTVVTTVLGSRIWHDDRRLFQEHIRWRRMLEGLKRYRKFPLLDSWGGLVNTISAMLPVLVLAIFFSQATVGHYGQAYQIVGLPVTLIGRAIAQVFFQRASEIRSSRANLVKTMEILLRSMVALGLFPTILLIIVGRELIVLVFGQNWAETGTYVQLLSLWAFLWFVYSPFSTVFAIIERQELFFIAHIVILVTRLIALVIGGISGNAPLAVGLFAGLGILTYGGLVIWSTALAGMAIHSFLRIVLRHGLYCAPMAGILLLLKLWSGIPVGLVLTASALALLIHYLLLLRYEPALFGYVKPFLKRKAQLRS